MLSYKFRCYPTKAQEIKIKEINNALKSVFNQLLYVMIYDYKNNLIELNKQGVKTLDAPKVVDILSLERNKWILDAGMPKQVFHNMVFYEFEKAKSNYIKKNYKKYKENKLEFNPKIEIGVPRFKKKNDNMSICFSNPKVTINSAKRIYIPKISDIKLVEHRELKGTIKEIRLSQDSIGHYYLSIRTDYNEVKEQPNLNQQVCGIDFGLKQWITLSDGTVYDCPSFYRDLEDRINEKNQRISELFEAELQRRKNIYKKLKEQNPDVDEKRLKKQAEIQAHSNRLEKLRKEVAVLQLKIANRRKAYIQNTVVEIYKKHPVVVIPNLYVRELQSVSASRVKDKNINKKLNDASLGLLKETFITVAKRDGYICKLALKSYPFAKTCSRCNEVNKDLDTTLTEEWTCPCCGAKNNTFLNSAFNLQKLYLDNKEELLVDEPTQDKSYKKSIKQLAEEKQEQRDANNPNLV